MQLKVFKIDMQLKVFNCINFFVCKFTACDCKVI